jgi:hypothetical protein
MLSRRCIPPQTSHQAKLFCRRCRYLKIAVSLCPQLMVYLCREKVDPSLLAPRSHCPRLRPSLAGTETIVSRTPTKGISASRQSVLRVSRTPEQKLSTSLSKMHLLNFPKPRYIFTKDLMTNSEQAFLFFPEAASSKTKR